MKCRSGPPNGRAKTVTAAPPFHGATRRHSFPQAISETIKSFRHQANTLTRCKLAALPNHPPPIKWFGGPPTVERKLLWPTIPKYNPQAFLCQGPKSAELFPDARTNLNNFRNYQTNTVTCCKLAAFPKHPGPIKLIVSCGAAIRCKDVDARRFLWGALRSFLDLMTTLAISAVLRAVNDAIWEVFLKGSDGQE